MISTMFTEVFSRQDWLKLMDFMFLHIKKVGSPLLVPVAIMSVHEESCPPVPHRGRCYAAFAQPGRQRFSRVIKTLTGLIKNTSPKYLSAMATGKKEKQEDGDFNDNMSLGTQTTGKFTNYSVKSSVSGRSTSQGHAGYKFSEVEEALECLALSGVASFFRYTSGHIPLMISYLWPVVDWQLRDRHRAITAINEVEGKLRQKTSFPSSIRV